jgi:hypothetical protein
LQWLKARYASVGSGLKTSVPQPTTVNNCKPQSTSVNSRIIPLFPLACTVLPAYLQQTCILRNHHGL